jgi:ABC-type uncharacterized transport system substrate-binding protein
MRVLPNTKTVAVVVGTSPIEKVWSREIAKEAQPFASRVTFIWYNCCSFEEILKQSAALPPDSAIFWELMLVDAAGIVHEEGKALKRLHDAANAPIFGYYENNIGEGVVGGPYIPIPETGRRTAEVAVRILRGEKAGGIKVAPVGFATPKFDWREIRRWGISEALLPEGSEVLFRLPTTWER